MRIEELQPEDLPGRLDFSGLILNKRIIADFVFEAVKRLANDNRLFCPMVADCKICPFMYLKIKGIFNTENKKQHSIQVCNGFDEKPGDYFKQSQEAGNQKSAIIIIKELIKRTN